MMTNEQVPARGRWDRVAQWLDEHLGLSAFAYPVPKYANSLPYVLGGISFIGFVVLVVTGVWLAQFYHPHPDQAHASVAFIASRAPGGALVRSLHFWAANLVAATVLLHMIRVHVTASYKHPREANWFIGLVLLALTFAFIFTGTVLRWDQEAYEALQHNVEIGELLGWLGSWFSPGFAKSTPLLVRLYITHVTFLPLILALFLLAHFFLIKWHGISPWPSRGARVQGRSIAGSQSRFTAHIGRMVLYGLLLFVGVGILLAALAPSRLGPSPTPGIEVTKPPWMFYWLYTLEDWWGIRALLWAPVVLFILLALVPLVDRNPWLHPARRPLMMMAGAIVFAVILGLSLVTALAPPKAHLGTAGE